MENLDFQFTSILINNLNQEEYYSAPQKTIFTTLEWIDYISEDSGAKPIIIRITYVGNLVGYFTGLLFSKFGIKIIGSPFNGWSTCFMGLDLSMEVDRLSIYSQLRKYLMDAFKCQYIEITDRFVDSKDAKLRSFTCLPMNTLELQIDRDDEQLFKAFKVDCRNFIRQFERRGATLEIASPDDFFAEEYYNQLKDVFAKQSLRPTYSLEKVKSLLRNLGTTENILCYRVRDEKGNSIATSIFVGYGQRVFFWGGASYRTGQHYRPNEYMIWSAIRYWRERGCSIFDMVGVRDYKRKFGSVEKNYIKLVFTKYKLLLIFRNLAKETFFIKEKILGYFLSKKQ